MLEGLNSVSLNSTVQSAKYGWNLNSQSVANIEEPSKGGFKDVLSGMVKSVNDELSAPDKLLKEAMLGNKDVDVHQVMTAVSKADISINVATQVVSKVIQAYDKILQIQV